MDCAPVLESVVNDPAAGVVPPIAGGVAAFAVANVPNAVPLVFVQVVARAPAVVVQSPVRAGNCAAARVPDTSVPSATAPYVGAPEALPCNTVVVVPSEPTTVGVPPAPPPNTSAFAVSAAELASPVALEKYGMPPDVPVAPRARVPDPVTGEPVTVKIPGAVKPTEVTVPVAAHAPSPRKNVDTEQEPDHKP